MAANTSSALAVSSLGGNWTTNLTYLPKIKQGWILDHLKDVNDDKSYKFFIEGFVQHVLVMALSDSSAAVKARCFPSQKTGHHLLCILFTDKGILDAYCGCPAGLSETCHHVAALLRLLFDLQARGYKEVPDAKTSTDKLCHWIAPAKAGTQGKRLDALEIRRHKNGVLSKRKILKPLPTVFDPRSPYQRFRDEDRMSAFIGKLRACNSTCGFITHFGTDPCSGTPNGHDNLQASNTTSTIMNQPERQGGPTKENEPAETQDKQEQQPSQLKIAGFINENYPVLTDDQVLEIEAATRGQACNKYWLEIRKTKITSSNFGTVVKCRKPETALKRILYQNVPKVPSILHGQEYEATAVKRYIELKQINEMVVSECGIFIHKELSYLAASPDRLVTDPTRSPQDGLIEVKCPFSKKDETVKEACSDKGFFCCLEGDEVVLKKNHNYYYQVQGQMAVTNRDWCDFVVFTFKDTEIIHIQFDSDFWAKAFKRLKCFLHDAFVPELLLLKERARK